MHRFAGPRASLPIVMIALMAGALACGDIKPPAPTVADEANAAEGAPLQSRAQSLGEPIGDYPSHAERLVLYLTNRARTEPTAFNADEPYPPTPPLRYDAALGQAARWQARHIIEETCWCQDHSSCCEIGHTTEGVACVGPTTGCGATDVGTRVGFFSSKYSGENAANGYPSAGGAVDGWIHSSGHWANINSGSHNLLGPGRHGLGWVQVFGRDSQPVPVAGDGIHFTDGSSLRFGITYYQPGTGGPRTALVIVNGECHELDLVNGEPEHGAFETSVPLENGCHRYYFHLTDGEGNDHTYPSSGSLAVAMGHTEDCPLYQSTRPADTCSPSGQPCETGQTRRCYTGPFGTEGVGICQAGSERCVGAQWTGECRGQLLPSPNDVCGNGLDDNCSGVVDEHCPDGDDADAGDPGGDADESDASDSRRRQRSNDGCGVASSEAPTRPLLAALFLLGLGAWRRRGLLQRLMTARHDVAKP